MLVYLTSMALFFRKGITELHASFLAPSSAPGCSIQVCGVLGRCLHLVVFRPIASEIAADEAILFLCRLIVGVEWTPETSSLNLRLVWTLFLAPLITAMMW